MDTVIRFKLKLDQSLQGIMTPSVCVGTAGGPVTVCSASWHSHSITGEPLGKGQCQLRLVPF